MEKQFRQCKEFNDTFNSFYNAKPSLDVPEDIKAVRKTLLQEELNEIFQAIDENEPLENLAKELADLMYVTIGMIMAYGLQDKFTEIFTAVHESNMSKVDDAGKPIQREDGKFLKGPNYKKPDIASILK